MRVFARLCAWLLMTAIAVLSLVPAHYRPATEVPHGVEHFVIFFVAGAVFAFAYPARIGTRCLTLAAFAAAIEIAQIPLPTRHARLSDFVVDALAACAGVAGAWMTDKLAAPMIARRGT